MIIKDEILNPWYIVHDYNGYSVFEGINGKRLYGPTKDLNESLMDILKRQSGESTDQMTLKEYVVWQNNRFKAMQDAVKPEDEIPVAEVVQ